MKIRPKSKKVKILQKNYDFRENGLKPPTLRKTRFWPRVLLRPLYAAIFRKMPGHGQDRTGFLFFPGPSKVKKKVQILLTSFFGPSSRGPEHFFGNFRTFRDLSGPKKKGRKTRFFTFFKISNFRHFFLVPSGKFQNFGQNRVFSCFPEKLQFFEKITFSSQFSTPQTQDPDPSQTPES